MMSYVSNILIYSSANTKSVACPDSWSPTVPLAAWVVLTFINRNALASLYEVNGTRAQSSVETVS